MFRRRAGIWDITQRLDRASGEFGIAVALDGDTLLAGAHRKFKVENQTLGTADLYRFEAGAWQEIDELAPRGAPEQFGWALDVQGSRAVVSTPRVLAGRGEGKIGIETPR